MRKFFASLFFLVVAILLLANGGQTIYCWLLLAVGVIFFMVSVRPKKIKEKIPDS